MESEFPSNSSSTKAETAEKVAKPEPKKIEKVIQGDVVRRKKPLGARFKDVFVGGEARGVWNYVTMDVMVPAAKDMFADAVSQGVERMIFGESRSTGRRSGQRNTGGSNGFVSYNRYAPNNGPNSGRREEPRNNVSRRSRSQFNFDEIVVPTRVEAEEVIDRLFDLVSRYESATVADLYELVGVSGNYTDEKYGWGGNDCLRGAGVTRITNGYLLDLPKPELLD